MLFFVVTLHITERAAEGRTRLLAWLVPLTLLWTNVHGGFFVVFLVLACYIGSDLLNAVIDADSDRRRRFLRNTRPWLLTFGACLAATFVNPYGWGLHRHIIEYITDPYQLRHIDEFQALNFHSPAVVYFEPLVVLALLTALHDARNRRFADVLLNLGWLHLALMAQRNLPIFALASTPLVARGITEAIEAARAADLTSRIGRAAKWFRGASLSFEETDRLWRVHAAGILPLVAIGALLLAPRPAGAKFISSHDPAVFPARALPVLSQPDARRIFSVDQWGDFLIYRLYPSKKVFVDGRSDFYGDDFGERYLDVLNVSYDWEKTLDKYAIDTILLSTRAPLASAVKLSRDWRVAYDDGMAIVFRRVDRGRPRQTGSPVSGDGGSIRDRAITQSTNRDRKITQPTT